MSRQKLNLATPKQVRLLTKFGIPNAQTISFKQASEIINQRFNRK
jgi:hypothetical protein